MTDVLIRNVPEDALTRVDENAARAGLSRGEYLRRQIVQDAARATRNVTVADLKRFAELNKDLLDESVMRDAWS